MPELIDLPNSISEALQKSNLSKLARQTGISRRHLIRLKQRSSQSRQRHSRLRIRHTTLSKLQIALQIAPPDLDNKLIGFVQQWAQSSGSFYGLDVLFYLQDSLATAKKIYLRAHQLNLLPPLKLKMKCDEVAITHKLRGITEERLTNIMMGATSTFEELCLIAQALQTSPAKLFVPTRHAPKLLHMWMILASARDPSDPSWLQNANLPTKVKDYLKAVKKWRHDPQAAKELNKIAQTLGIKFQP